MRLELPTLGCRFIAIDGGSQEQEIDGHIHKRVSLIRNSEAISGAISGAMISSAVISKEQTNLIV